MSTEDTIGTALTTCYFCGGSNEVIINTKLTKQHADAVKELNGKVVSMHPCDKCDEYMKKGIILLTIDSSKSDKNWNIVPPSKPKHWIPNPYRAGGFAVITEEGLANMLGEDSDMYIWAKSRRWMFLEHEVALRMGLFANANEQ